MNSSNTSINKRLRSYSQIAVGSTLASSSTAMAAVVMHQDPGGPVTATTATDISWDMTDNATINTSPSGIYEFGLSGHGDIHWNGGSGAGMISQGSDTAVNVPAGYIVSAASLNMATGIGYAYVDSGDFSVGAIRGFVGVQFDISGSTHYGWAEIEFDGAGNQTLHRWAYEDQPGVGITIPVPEPSSLALLSLGAAGLVTTRRRKKVTC